VRLNAPGTLHRSANRIDLRFRNDLNLLAAGEDHVNARRADNLQPPTQDSPDENIAGEKGQGEKLLSILPTPQGLMQRQKDIETLSHEHFSDGLFVLMLGVNRPPGRLVGRIFDVGCIRHLYITTLCSRQAQA
jgi:hypothetical protein